MSAEFDKVVEEAHQRAKIELKRQEESTKGWVTSRRPRVVQSQSQSTPFETGFSSPSAVNFSGSQSVAAVVYSCQPFQIITKKISGVWKYGVSYNSPLFKGTNTTDPTSPQLQTISGLLTSKTPSNSDSGWITWSGSTDPVWIESNLSSVNVRSYSGGGDYGGGDVENGGGSYPYSQTKWRKLIAKITSDSDGTPLVEQFVASSLRLFTTAMSSADSSGGTTYTIPCQYPF